MTGTEWLKQNADKLTDCPLGKVTLTACRKRVRILKTPGLWKAAYQFHKCIECPQSGIDDASALFYRNFEIEQEGE